MYCIKIFNTIQYKVSYITLIVINSKSDYNGLKILFVPVPVPVPVDFSQTNTGSGPVPMKKKIDTGSGSGTGQKFDTGRVLLNALHLGCTITEQHLEM